MAGHLPEDLSPFDRTWSGGADPHRFDGDFYAQEEVSRGVSLAPGTVFGDEYNLIGPDTFSIGGVDAALDGGGCSGKVKAAILQDFTAEYEPPCLPSYPLETSTHWVMTSSKLVPHPSDIMNLLKRFLVGEENEQTRVTKVTPRKFTMKASVFIGASNCDVKARLYREEGACYALEWQRRNGCSLCFLLFVQQVSQHLSEQRLLDPSRAPTRTNTPQTSFTLDTLSDDGEVGNVAPYLDMAGLKDLPTCQAEAAAGLVQYLRSHSEKAVSAAVSQICENFERVQDLVACQSEAASVHTTILLQQLSQHEEGREKLMGDTLVSQLHFKANSADSSLVRSEYGELLQVLGSGSISGFQKYGQDTKGGSSIHGVDKMSSMWADSSGQEFAGFDDPPPMPSLHRAS